MAHRRDVNALLSTSALTLVLVAVLVWPVAAAPEQPCEVVPMPCTFEGMPFKLTVIDAETRKPLADVHALAEWQIHGAGGRLNGPLMVLDAASGPDGALAFPGWGPVDGSVMGLGIGRDPIITLFKSGYKALVINNADPPGTLETQRVRRFYQDGRTYELEPFRGTDEEWIHELKQIYRGVAFPRDDKQAAHFRGPYLNRLRCVWAERSKVPATHLARPGFFWFVSEYMLDLEGAK